MFDRQRKCLISLTRERKELPCEVSVARLSMLQVVPNPDAIKE